MLLQGKKKGWSCGIILFFLCYALILPTLAERRVALIIGNGNYQRLPYLKNPVHDATDLSTELNKAKFEVSTGLDLKKDEMVKKIASFNSRLQKEDTVVFFYAGHGMQVNGQNLIVPIDASIRSDKDVYQATLSMQEVLESISSRVSRLIVFLDACRDNPFKESFNSPALLAVQPNGLAKEILNKKNVFFAFATEPGNVAFDGGGRNSPFTTALLEQVPKNGLELSNMMVNVRKNVFEKTKQQQLPWSNSSLLDYFYFLEPSASNDPVQPSSRVGTSTDPAALLASANELFAEKNFVQSAVLYKRAANLNVRKAMAVYGKLLQQGIGIPQDRKAANIWFKRAAKAGDPESQFLLARNFERGTGGIRKNHKSAFEWYLLAAKGGNDGAMNNLAVKYFLGEGVKKNFSQAVHWLKLASEKGHSNALFNLASLYDDGKGVKKSPAIAAQLIMRSILQGNKSAKLEMKNNHAAWSRPFKKEFQKQLRELGLYSGRLDASFGRGTRGAIDKVKPVSHKEQT